MTTQALTFPNYAPAVQDDVRPGETARRALTWSLIVAGALLTVWILGEVGPVVYGLPVPLVRRSASAVRAEA